MAGSEHWNERYESVGTTSVSWFEDIPEMSLDLLDAVDVESSDSVIDIGGGASRLVDHLLQRGHRRVGVLDVSAFALHEAMRRVTTAENVEWIESDLLRWEPQHRWSAWHDRAVLHFLTEDADSAAYSRLLRRALLPGGAFVIGVFAEDGPTRCSGLPVRRYSPEDLRQLVGQAGELEIVAEKRHVHHTPSDAPQAFNWIAGRLKD